ncbi:MAG: FAD-binding protein, partial [Pseudonocardiaceae bacterium]
VGKCWKITSNSWEYTGDGHALALDAGADLIDMECIQFHPTGMVWPPSVRGILVTEGVRGDGGILTNTEGKRFMFDYITEYFKAETADNETEADAWYADHQDVVFMALDLSHGSGPRQLKMRRSVSTPADTSAM